MSTELEHILKDQYLATGERQRNFRHYEVRYGHNSILNHRLSGRVHSNEQIYLPVYDATGRNGATSFNAHRDRLRILQESLFKEKDRGPKRLREDAQGD